MKTLANSQQHWCKFAQLIFYREAGPAADEGQADELAPSVMAGLR